MSNFSVFFGSLICWGLLRLTMEMPVHHISYCMCSIAPNPDTSDDFLASQPLPDSVWCSLADSVAVPRLLLALSSQEARSCRRCQVQLCQCESPGSAEKGGGFFSTDGLMFSSQVHCSFAGPTVFSQAPKAAGKSAEAAIQELVNKHGQDRGSHSPISA